MRAILLVIAAIAALTARPAAAQDAAPPAATPRNEPPVYSLVIARATSALPFPDFYGDRCALCLNPIHVAAFDSAQTLAGPPVATSFGATMFWHSWFTRGGYPMLLVVRHLDGGLYHIAAYARGPDAQGMGCLTREDVATVGWRPEGSGIIARDGEICASLAAIAALPLPPDPRFDGPPITVVSMAEITLRPASLVVGRRVHERETGLPPCPETLAEDQGCYEWVGDTELADVQTLSGPRLPDRIMARHFRDTPPPAGEDVAMIVMPYGTGIRQVLWVRALDPDASDLCLSRSELASYNLRPSRGAWRRGEDEICFPV